MEDPTTSGVEDGGTNKDRAAVLLVQPGIRKRKVASRKSNPVNKRAGVQKSNGNEHLIPAVRIPVEVDNVMLEFDQYVMYHDMKKKTEEIISSQEKIVSQGRSCSSPEGTQQNVNETCYLEVAKGGSKDLEQSLQCSVLLTEIEPTTEDNIKEAMVKNKNNHGLVVSEQEGPQLYSTKVKEICVVDPIAFSTSNCLDAMTVSNGGEISSGGILSSVAVLEKSDQEEAVAQESFQHSDDAMSRKYSDEDTSDSDSKHEEYLFPTPDELEKTSIPQLGKVFPTLEDAVRFVNVYAHTTGFGIKKGRNYKDRKITICCNKSRKSVTTYKGTRKRKRSVVQRTNCQMHVTVSLQDGKWHITAQNLIHNHDLASSPSLTKFFLSHRNMNEAEKLLSRLLQEHRVKPRKIMSIFRKLSGGKLGNITFDVKKLDNLKRDDREKRRNTDIEHTMDYIEKLQIEKPGFIYKAQRDSSNTVLSLFWTDSRSRLDYLLYGDIICFDTTFSTNKYNMPFTPIIGVNGHSRTIVFGWALLQNEKANTFRWLFETFVEVMGGKKPRVVLTDQDAAMKLAIPKVFPDAFHRFCIWHVKRKARENLSVYMALKKGMEEAIDDCIMQSITVEEFEKSWHEMELKYNCGKHAHIKRMWENKQYFVPAYFQGVFCPFTRSTSRSESFNSNFKDYVMRKDSIETFIRQYELFQENVIHIENQDRFISNEKVPVMWGYQRVERHAAEIYTRAIYCKFLTELLNSTAFGVKEIEKDQTYEVKRNFPYENPEFQRELFSVRVNCDKEEFVCICGKFERDGILCCHILRLFTQFDLLKIPDQYIVPRWTREFREKELRKHKFDALGVHAEDQSHNAVRYAIVMNRVGEVCSDISHDSALCDELMDAVHAVHNKYLASMKKNLAGEEQKQQEGRDDGDMTLKDPVVIKNKSVRKGNRLKSRSEREGWRKAAEKRKKSI